jgi:hypothetical protein
MRDIARPAVAALAIVGLALSAAALSGGHAFAQTRQAPAQAAPPADAAMKQMALTDKQIQGVLAAQKDMNALDDKLPDSPDLLPDLPSFISRLCSGFGPGRGGLRTRSV